jgi:5-methylcytosine-specific restriction endonuclease McrA
MYKKITFLFIYLFNCTVIFSDCYATNYSFSDYLDTIDKIVISRTEKPKSIYKKQREILIEHEKDIRKLNFNIENSHNTYLERRKNFDHDGGREILIEEWEKELNVSWPQYTCEKCCRKKTNCGHSLFEAHHIIPLGYNGQNAWWNIFPLTVEEHTGKGGIHSSEEAKQMFKKVKK